MVLNAEKALNEYIIANATSVDVDRMYDEMLDEVFDFAKIGVPFESMLPSRVLKEIDPIAYRCGCADYQDSLRLVDIEGEYFELDECETWRDAFLDEMGDELSPQQRKTIEEVVF